MEIIKNAILSINSPNIFAFYEKDHATRDKTADVKKWAIECFEKRGLLQSKIKEIMLLTHLRCMGFIFNPVSFYFAINSKNQVIGVIAEVNNTFSQTHSYIICEEDCSPILPHKKYRANKEFSVSPFFTREGEYEFQFSYSEEKIIVLIDYFKNGELALTASVKGKRIALSKINLIKTLFTTFKTVILILLQAVKLVLKGVKFKKPPNQLANKITFNKKI